ncbi:EcsC family protein [Alisedimentitalea sp. MJ-SS2]|uniref:EcsC family protein n=1 Tax=Aliisedimentitalea sp. MJ-SS2 TaxID=3049795 RepID=UPI002914C2A7|nr:EcsC family protein [Alisedimentitalea sp. MJ-SS2]MDU8928751.1 EcsC family protein [Alisedimentitalea sp. MJ-SS2]
MEILPDTPADLNVDAELDALAKRYRGASGAGIQLLNLIGGQTESLLEKLPDGVRNALSGQTEAALRVALKAAHGSRNAVPDQPGWLNTALATAMGAAGGAGGLPTALAELPVTTTVLLRAIQGIAAEHGFDPEEEGVQFDCIQVFSAAGPLEHDDGSDLAFISTRVLVTGTALQSLIARVAPRLAVVLGQKLAAQTVPILGAVAGAATNYAYTSYYQDMAHVHFGLRRLAITADRDQDELIADLRERVRMPPVKKAG